MVQTTIPLNSIGIRRDPAPSSSPYLPKEGRERGEPHEYRDKGPQRAAEITAVNSVQISSKLSVRVKEATGSWVIFASSPVSLPPVTPTGIRRFNTQVCQNVGGLWLKYGVKALKLRAFALCEILCRDATIC